MRLVLASLVVSSRHPFRSEIKPRFDKASCSLDVIHTSKMLRVRHPSEFQESACILVAKLSLFFRVGGIFGRYELRDLHDSGQNIGGM